MRTRSVRTRFSDRAFSRLGTISADCSVLAGRGRYSCRHDSISNAKLKIEGEHASHAHDLCIWLFVCGAVFLRYFSQAKLPASPIKTIYVIPSSHYDFGFIEPPNAIRERAARHVDEIIRVGEENPNFRWTIESVWQINEWL